jgi:tetratricopeptide (TPR) repeat protein
MPYLWWGVSCQQRQDNRLANVVADDIGQLVANLGPALKQLEAKEATRDAAIGLGRTLFALAPFSDIPGILDGLVELRSGFGDLFRALRDQADDNSETRRVDPSRVDGAQIAGWIGAIGSLLGTAGIPLVVIVDDAHWADPLSIDFFGGLLKRVPCLMVFTAWPDQLTIQERNDELNDAGAMIGRWQDRVTTLEVARLSESDTSDMAIAALGVDPSHPIVSQLTDRANGNPLMLRLWGELDFVQRAAAAGIKLDDEDLRALPEDAEVAYQRRWRGLPAEARTVLGPAAYQGTLFVPSLVVETVSAVGLLDDVDGQGAFVEAEDPHQWIRSLVRGTAQFSEPLLTEIAARRFKSEFSAMERRDLDSAFVASLGRLRSSTGWLELSTAGRRTLLTHHIQLVKLGEPGEPKALIASYWELADLQPESWAGWTNALELIEAAISLVEPVSPDESTLLNLRKRQADLLERLGRTTDALRLFEQVYDDTERIFGGSHPSTLIARNDIAVCLWEQGRPADALPLLERSLSDRMSVLPDEHPEVLTTRNNLALCLQALGRAPEALEHFERTFASREATLGPDHPRTVQSRNNVAQCLEWCGRTSEALPIYDIALGESRRILGSDHPTTLITRSNRATCLQKEGRSDEALQELEQTLAEQERVVGQDHPDALTTRSHLAVVLESDGRADEALTAYQSVMADQTRILGGGHPETLTTKHNLGLFLLGRGQTEDAVCLLEPALAGRESTLGADNPATIDTTLWLARSLRTAGRPTEALRYFERILEVRTRELGGNHPLTLASVSELGGCLQATGSASAALPYFELALQGRERSLGVDHPDTLTSRGILATCLMNLGRLDEAIMLNARTLADRQRVLGVDHPDTRKVLTNLTVGFMNVKPSDDSILGPAASRMLSERPPSADSTETMTARANLAAALWRAGFPNEATAFQESVLADRERVLGPVHPETTMARANMALFHGQTGNSPDAIPMLREAIAAGKSEPKIDRTEVQAWRSMLAQWVGA